MSQQIESANEPRQELAPAAKKRGWFSPCVRTLLAIVVIAVAVVLAFRGPAEGESGNVTGDPAFIPTVGITNTVDILAVNKSVTVQGLRHTITQVTEAAKFSNDRKRAGTYTVRVTMQTKNSGTQPIGIQYASIMRLVLADGQVITPKYISVLPVTLPDMPQTGFMDFPVSSQVALSSLTLRFGSDATMTLAG